jgi:putrescine transport system ATP-binding protein
MDLQQNVGLTFLIVTHDQEEAMTVADRIAVMDHGKLIQVATPSEIYEQPNSKYVADFIGDINLIEGKVASVDSSKKLVSIKANGLDTPITVESDQVMRSGDQVWVAIRPEKMRILLDQPKESDGNVLAGSVYDIGYLGDASVYHVKIPTGQNVRSVVANVTRLVERPISWEDKVWLWWPRDASVLLTR